MFSKTVDSQKNEISEYILKLANMAEIREGDNSSHLNRIKAFCQVLCLGMGIPKRESEIISISSQLHDIGKIFIPEKLISLKGNYQEDDWMTIQKHTLDGSAFLKKSSSVYLQTGAIIAEYHHERFNGSGYPYGRRGEEIPVAAKIFAVADVYDALVTPRPYKDLLDDKDAFELILDSKGVLFDPKVVDVFSNKYQEIVSIKNAQS
ncbi:HD domain-containing protein [bacterium]|nr:HD domain-containing protein [bacterium]